MKLQEGAAAPEIRKWRYNFVTNCSFREGRFKGVGVGGGNRWQDKVIIGYPVSAGGSFDLVKPYFGPAEDGIDLWTGYERKLNERLTWKLQLNVRNAFARDGLIPVSIQPGGRTWASVRVEPNQEWFVTNTISCRPAAMQGRGRPANRQGQGPALRVRRLFFRSGAAVSRRPRPSFRAWRASRSWSARRR